MQGGVRKDRRSVPIGHGAFFPVGELEQANPLRRQAEGRENRCLRAYETPLSPCRLEKLRVEKCRRPYRKPPLVGWDTSPKVFELTSAKELDKRAL
jgi:hypothetical protein